MSSSLAPKPGYAGYGHPELSALRVNGTAQFLRIVKDAIRANRGVLVNAAEALKVSRDTLRKWIAHYEVLGTAIEEAREAAKAEDAAAEDES